MSDAYILAGKPRDKQSKINGISVTTEYHF